jgi:hypothetical protein
MLLHVTIPDHVIVDAVRAHLSTIAEMGATPIQPALHLPRAPAPRFVPLATSASGDRYAKLPAIPGPGQQPHDAFLDNETCLIWSASEICAPATHEDATKAAGACQLLGLSGWRLPTDEEWQTLISRKHYKPALNPDAAKLMHDVVCEGHWTSVRDASAPESCAWGVYLDDGYVGINCRYDRLRARVVRSAVPGQ